MLVYHTTILTTAPIATIHAPALAPFPNPLEKGFLNPSLLAGILSKGFAVGSYYALGLDQYSFDAQYFEVRSVPAFLKVPLVPDR